MNDCFVLALDMRFNFTEEIFAWGKAVSFSNVKQYAKSAPACCEHKPRNMVIEMYYCCWGLAREAARRNME